MGKIVLTKANNKKQIFLHDDDLLVELMWIALEKKKYRQSSLFVGLRENFSRNHCPNFLDRIISMKTSEICSQIFNFLGWNYILDANNIVKNFWSYSNFYQA